MRNPRIEELRKRWLESARSALPAWSAVNPGTKVSATSDLSDLTLAAGSETAEQRIAPAENFTRQSSSRVDEIIEPVPAAQASTSLSDPEPHAPGKSNLEIEQEPTSAPGAEGPRSGPASDEPPTPDSTSLSSAHHGELITIGKEEVGSSKAELVSDPPKVLFSLRSAQKIAALWIDGSEQIAKQGLEFQARATAWSKNTMLEAVFEIQNAIARGWVELSANAARRFWQLE